MVKFAQNSYDLSGMLEFEEPLSHRDDIHTVTNAVSENFMKQKAAPQAGATPTSVRVKSLSYLGEFTKPTTTNDQPTEEKQWD